MNRELPGFFIQTSDGVLHAYWRLDILLCDLTTNRAAGAEKPAILKCVPGRPGQIRYVPISEEELRKGAA